MAIEIKAKVLVSGSMKNRLVVHSYFDGVKVYRLVTRLKNCVFSFIGINY